MSEPINSTISPWIPMTDPHQLAHFGKMAEEASELAGRAARCMIQGLDSLDPETGRPNYEEIAREMADVEACIIAIRAEYNTSIMYQRTQDKLNGYHRWHRMIDDHIHNQAAQTTVET